MASAGATLQPYYNFVGLSVLAMGAERTATTEPVQKSARYDDIRPLCASESCALQGVMGVNLAFSALRLLCPIGRKKGCAALQGYRYISHNHQTIPPANRRKCRDKSVGQAKGMTKRSARCTEKPKEFVLLKEHGALRLTE